MRKAFLYLLPTFMFIAVVLKLAGVNSVLGNPALINFFKRVNMLYNDSRLVIPSVPSISQSAVQGAGDIFKLLASFVNYLVTLINALISIVQIVFDLVQYLYHIVEAIVIMMKDFGADNPIINI